jgi:formylglycine-generating enzyme required for sulfatase activity
MDWFLRFRERPAGDWDCMLIAGVFALCASGVFQQKTPSGGGVVERTTEPKSILTEKKTADPLITAIKFVRVPKGTFWMSKDGKNAQVQKEIAADFELAAYTVTQEQWQAVMGDNPSYFSRNGGGKEKVQNVSDAELKQFPVENVSCEDVQKFLQKLNEREKGRGRLYRLPSEAEWDYACRGGVTSKEECSYSFYFDKPTNDLSSKQANFWGEYPAGQVEKGAYLGRTTKVGSYAKNKLGLYDMHGNVWQWCNDLWDGGGSLRVLRGGSWFHPGVLCAASYRHWFEPDYRYYDVGFRLLAVPSGSS